MSWDISNPAFGLRTKKLEELEALLHMSELNNWEVDLKEELSVTYEALVLTDSDQTILWVNHGFQAMTGYTPQFALGKKPRFLQGIKTCKKAKSRIGRNLALGKRISETLTNYRKNGEEYICQISIIPLINSTQDISHFLALETEIR
nr:PAS domain-containing protein [Algoriphagus locisalis]